MRVLIASLFVAFTLSAQTAPLAVQTTSLAQPALRKFYSETLRAGGGVASLRWDLTAGTLPPGLTLESYGVLEGVPTKPGSYRFTVRVTDSARPPRSATREFLLTVPAALSVRWTQSPHVDSGGISGQVEIDNQSGDTLDLTVIVVAVNEIGKAFALGYRHDPQPVGKLTVPFASTLPRGSYVVHADAIGEFAPIPTIYRARLQTPQPLVVP